MGTSNYMWKQNEADKIKRGDSTVLAGDAAADTVREGKEDECREMERKHGPKKLKRERGEKEKERKKEMCLLQI